MTRLAAARRGLWLLIPTLLIGGGVGATEPHDALLADDFSSLSQERWEPIRIHDARRDHIEANDGWLCLGLDTGGTDDATVKLRGVRSRRTFEVKPEGPPLTVEVTLDWNGQTNGSYLTAGLALLPADEDDPPQAASEALAFEFVGVPPGRNARPSLWRRRASGLRPLYTEGWPQPRRADRVGRKVERVKLTLEVGFARVRLLEDGRARYQGPGGLGGRLRLLLFVTSHSNYPERAVRFDDLRVYQR